MPTNDNSRIALTAARLALTAIWTAVPRERDAFDDPRFTWPGSSQPQSIDLAAVYLSELPKPLHLLATLSAGSSQGDAVLDLEVRDSTASVNDAVPSSPSSLDVADLLPAQMDSRVLFIGGGRGLRVNRAAVEQLCRDYRLSPRPAIAGGALDDEWAPTLQLPDAWLERVGAIFLFGTGEDGRAKFPLGLGKWSTLVDS